jgi:acetoin utilization protein AcuB
MLIRELMTQNVITTEEDKTILEVRELMRNKNIRRLPVTDDIKRIKGMITDGDVAAASRLTLPLFPNMRQTTSYPSCGSGTL